MTISDTEQHWRDMAKRYQIDSRFHAIMARSHLHNDRLTLACHQQEVAACSAKLARGFLFCLLSTVDENTTAPQRQERT